MRFIPGFATGNARVRLGRRPTTLERRGLSRLRRDRRFGGMVRNFLGMSPVRVYDGLEGGMPMIELFFVTCLIDDPQVCTDHSLLFEERNGLFTCMLEGQKSAYCQHTTTLSCARAHTPTVTQRGNSLQCTFIHQKKGTCTPKLPE